MFSKLSWCWMPGIDAIVCNIFSVGWVDPFLWTCSATVQDMHGFATFHLSAYIWVQHVSTQIVDSSIKHIKHGPALWICWLTVPGKLPWLSMMIIPYRIGWEKKIWQNIFCMMLQCELTSISQRSFKRTWADSGRYIIHHDTRIESVLLFIQKITPHDSGKTRADISESESYKSGMWRIVRASACCYAWLRGAS